MTEGAPRQQNNDKKVITSPESRERCQAIAQELQENLHLGALEVLEENRKEAKNRFNIDTPDNIFSLVHSGVMIMNKDGEVVGKAGRSIDVDKEFNLASGSKVINALFMFIALSEQGDIDLKDLDKKQLPSRIQTKVNPDGSKEEFIIENEISTREFLERILGYSDNPQLSALRKMYVSHFRGEVCSPESAMDALQFRINEALNTNNDNAKYIPRGTTDAKLNPMLGNTAPLKTILESFRYAVRLCKDKNSTLPKEFRKVFLSSLKILPEEIVEITPSVKSQRLLHTFKRQKPEIGIREKSGWFADQGDNINTINSFAEIRIDGKIYYIGWYVEAPEVIKKSNIRFPMISVYNREYQQWKYMKKAGEVIKDILNKKELKLFT